MKSKKLVLCILIAMVFTFGIGTTNVLANETLGIQETNKIGFDALIDVTSVEDIVEDKIDAKDNVEDKADTKDKVEDKADTKDKVEDKADAEDKNKIKETAVIKKTTENSSKNSKVATKETTKSNKATKTSTKKTTKTVKTTKKAVEKKYTNSELRLLSALIYAEAGNQSYKGKLAVGNVVLNREKSSAFSHAKSVKEVVYDKKWGTQFSVIKKGSSGTSPLDKAISIYDSVSSANGAVKKNMLECIKAAKAALNGENNLGSYLSFNRNSKYLSNKYSNHTIIGDHIFYNVK